VSIEEKARRQKRSELNYVNRLIHKRKGSKETKKAKNGRGELKRGKETQIPASSKVKGGRGG